jgi:hypothetical protein
MCNIRRLCVRKRDSLTQRSLIKHRQIDERSNTHHIALTKYK